MPQSTAITSLVPPNNLAPTGYSGTTGGNVNNVHLSMQPFQWGMYLGQLQIRSAMAANLSMHNILHAPLPVPSLGFPSF